MLLKEILKHLCLSFRMRSSDDMVPQEWLSNDRKVEEHLLELGNLHQDCTTSFSNKSMALQSYRISYWRAILRIDDIICLYSVSI